MAQLQPFIMMFALFGVFWFMMIRPQMKRQKEHQTMLGALKNGDTIVTRGGLIGKIFQSSGTTLVVEFENKTKVKVMRSHVEGLYKPDLSQNTNSKNADSKKSAA